MTFMASASPLVYLDNNATTPLDPGVVEELLPFLREHHGNASSVHRFGQRARSAVEKARERVAELVGVAPREVVFTCGGTEADNTAVAGVARSRRSRGRHIVTTQIEHPAILKACEELEKEGFEVTYVGVDKTGRVRTDELAGALRDDTILVSVMLVNNETGTIQPMEEIWRLTRAREIVLHSDAVQAAGKIPLDFRERGLDLMSLSSHKFHGPKGVGALIVRDGIQFEPIMLGGGQERGRRGGTENVPGIVGMGRACLEAANHLAEMETRVAALRDRLEAGILELSPGAVVNGRGARRAPHVTNISFPGCDGEAILVALDFHGIAVSTGAACHSGSVSPSHVLTAMGLAKEVVQGAIRFSLSRMTTPEEIEATLRTLPQVLERMRQSSPLS